MMTQHKYSPEEMTRLIRQKALELGFSAIGMVSAEPFLASEQQGLRQWLVQGYQAEMGWMVEHLEKRLDPSSLMEGTRSIVCVAMNYYSPDEVNSAPDAVKIAKYARGTDYHHVVKDRLKSLLGFIQTLQPEVQGRALTDSAPIWEKALAAKAGLGWVGKNGNLILPQLGSWYFLGELLLDIPLVYDTSSAMDYCGSCTRCISACPTEAITSPAVVDANRCLSYWTIEYKGESIPVDISRKMDGWVFGCDICQDVCPWNLKFATPTQEEALQPRPWNRQPTIESLSVLDEETFKLHYRKSPVKRTKRVGLLRNVEAWRRAQAEVDGGESS